MPDDWMHITIEVPPSDGHTLLMLMRELMDFREVDHCELQRPDRARASYGPCPPRTTHGFTFDPFPPPGDRPYPTAPPDVPPQG